MLEVLIPMDILFNSTIDTFSFLGFLDIIFALKETLHTSLISGRATLRMDVVRLRRKK